MVNIKTIDIPAYQLTIAADRPTRCFELPSSIFPGSSRLDLDTQIATHLPVPISLSADPATELLLGFWAWKGIEGTWSGLSAHSAA
jgi:hypothetical protein